MPKYVISRDWWRMSQLNSTAQNCRSMISATSRRIIHSKGVLKMQQIGAMGSKIAHRLQWSPAGN